MSMTHQKNWRDCRGIYLTIPKIIKRNMLPEELNVRRCASALLETESLNYYDSGYSIILYFP